MSTAIPAYVPRGTVPITPNDSVDVGPGIVGFRVNVGGTIRFVDGYGQLRNWDVADGARETIVVKRVHATGTTATGIEGFLP